MERDPVLKKRAKHEAAGVGIAKLKRPSKPEKMAKDEKRHHHAKSDEVEIRKRRKEKEKKKKKKKKKKPKHDDEAKEDRKAVGENKEKKRDPKPKPDDAGSSGSRRRKVVRWRLSQELLDYVRTREVMGFLATETPRPLRPNIKPDLFPDEKLRKEIVAEFEENEEFDAYVLYQYRTKGYVEIQEEVTDDEEEEEDHHASRYLEETGRVVKEWFLAAIKGGSEEEVCWLPE